MEKDVQQLVDKCQSMGIDKIHFSVNEQIWPTLSREQRTKQMMACLTALDNGDYYDSGRLDADYISIKRPTTQDIIDKNWTYKKFRFVDKINQILWKLEQQLLYIKHRIKKMIYGNYHKKFEKKDTL